MAIVALFVVSSADSPGHDGPTPATAIEYGLWHHRRSARPTSECARLRFDLEVGDVFDAGPESN
jgi:hypothetical protein